MGNIILSSHNFALQNYDEIIDVRSPSEFIEDHIPGAINLPVLNDAERKTVGTLYKQVNPFEAKKLGAALISNNISTILNNHFMGKEKNYKALIYCWRGGQRSGSIAIVLSQIGWNITVLKGGYKYYRSQVRKCLESKLAELDYCILAGFTGTAKTKLLTLLKAKDEQVIDLENLARHKGSILGQLPGIAQPTQKYFESSMAAVIQNFSTKKTTWIESESSKIGNIHIPQSLWKNMKNTQAFIITASLDARVEYIIQDYPWFTQNQKLIRRKVSLLKNAHGSRQVKEWVSFIENNQWEELVKSLLSIHYDPSYSRSLGNNQRSVAGNINLPTMENSMLNNAIETLLSPGHHVSRPQDNKM